NNGWTQIRPGDYAAPMTDQVGIRVRFPERKVTWMAVTDYSKPHLRHCFGNDSGLGAHSDLIELPKVPLSRSEHYKVLVALERASGHRGGKFPDPVVEGGIMGGIVRGGMTKTTSGTPPRAKALIGFLGLVIVGQLIVSLAGSATAPLDCA